MKERGFLLYRSPMPLYTVDELKALGVTFGNDAAMRLIADEAEALITDAAGPNYDAASPLTHTEYERGHCIVRLPRDASSIQSVVEDGTTLDAADYELRYNSHLWKSTQSNWLPNVVVTYLPVDDTQKRRTAHLALVRLLLVNNAVLSSSDGNVTATNRDLTTQVRRILNTLRPVRI